MTKNIERLVSAVREWSTVDVCPSHGGPYHHEHECELCADEVLGQQAILDAFFDLESWHPELELLRTELAAAKAKLAAITCAECDRTMDVCSCRDGEGGAP